MVLAQILPHLGVNLGSDALTTTVTTIITLGAALWTMYRRTQLQKAPNGVGDVTVLGMRK